jgi:hypothetical protein
MDWFQAATCAAVGEQVIRSQRNVDQRADVVVVQRTRSPMRYQVSDEEPTGL